MVAKSLSANQKESCVCLHAVRGLPKRSTAVRVLKDQFTVEISVFSGAIQMTPLRKMINHRSSAKTFTYARSAFLSADDAGKRDILSKMIKAMEIPFPLKNINWGLYFPDENQTAPRFEDLDRIISDQLSEIAGDCVENNPKGYLDICIRSLEKLPSEEDDYNNDLKICGGNGGKNNNNSKQPLDDWIMENMNDAKFHRESCLGVLQKLDQESPAENRYFGLKSVKVVSDELFEDDRCCSMCEKCFKKGSQAIQLPCSHIFHGFCVLPWIDADLSCPGCGFELGTSTEFYLKRKAGNE